MRSARAPPMRSVVAAKVRINTNVFMVSASCSWAPAGGSLAPRGKQGSKRGMDRSALRRAEAHAMNNPVVQFSCAQRGGARPHRSFDVRPVASSSRRSRMRF